MKKYLFVVLLLVTGLSLTAYAEDAATAPAAAPATAAAEEAAPAPTPPAVDTAAPAAAPTTAAIPAEDAGLADNLEFVSGEVSVLDEPGKSVSVRLYGENEDTASDKVLKVGVDENTDITDGEQDRDLKSLAVGTEVDVEYDPATNKATYIFVY